MILSDSMFAFHWKRWIVSMNTIENNRAVDFFRWLLSRLTQGYFQFMAVRYIERTRIWLSTGWVFMRVIPVATMGLYLVPWLKRELTKSNPNTQDVWHLSSCHCSPIKIWYNSSDLFYIHNKEKKLSFYRNTDFSLEPYDESFDVSALVRKKEKKFKMCLKRNFHLLMISSYPRVSPVYWDNYNSEYFRGREKQNILTNLLKFNRSKGGY